MSAKEIVEEYISSYAMDGQASADGELTYKVSLLPVSEILSREKCISLLSESSDVSVVSVVSTSVEKEIITVDCFTYTHEELAGSNICYISENLEKNELFIIRCGGGKTTIDKYSKDSESQSWNKSNSKSIDKEIYKNLCKETESDFWIFTMNSNDNRIFIKISKETLEYKEVK